jgi:hypothetical protein
VLVAHLWPKGVVDFDAGINTAMRKLRAALGDDAPAPRYMETVPLGARKLDEHRSSARNSAKRREGRRPVFPRIVREASHAGAIRTHHEKIPRGLATALSDWHLVLEAAA